MSIIVFIWINVIKIASRIRAFSVVDVLLIRILELCHHFIVPIETLQVLERDIRILCIVVIPLKWIPMHFQMIKMFIQFLLLILQINDSLFEHLCLLQQLVIAFCFFTIAIFSTTVMIFIFVGSCPSDFVFLVLLNETNAFEDVGNIVNSSLLNCELAYSIVKIYTLLRCLLD